MRASEFSIPEIGINVRSDGDIDYADLIVDGRKKLETRNTDSLRPYVGKRVSIVKTGKGKAYAIGVATVGEPIEADEEQFRKLEKQHLVPPGSKFDIVPGTTKFLYPMINPKRYDRPREVGHGIISRKVYVEDEIISVNEKWSQKYKRSINCNNPKGFSQRAHCQGRKKKANEEYTKDGKYVIRAMTYEAGDGMVGYSGAHELAGSAFDKIKEKLKDGVLKLKKVLATETEETKQMWAVLQRLAKRDKTVTPEEKKQATAQFFDLVKLAGLGAIFKFTFHIPFSTEGIYLIAKLINKYTGIQILPSSLTEHQMDEARNDKLAKFINTSLKNAGYKKLGSGIDANVWMKDQGTVVKIIMPDLDPDASINRMQAFYKFAKQHPEIENLPKFKKADGREFFKFSLGGVPFMQFSMEQLYPIKKGSLDEYVVWFLSGEIDKNWKTAYNNLVNFKDFRSKFKPIDTDQVETYRKFFETFRLLYKIGVKNKWGWDAHTENVMKRSDGTLVITDPWA